MKYPWTKESSSTAVGNISSSTRCFYVMFQESILRCKDLYAQCTSGESPVKEN